MPDQTSVVNVDNTANPAPLGLMAFGMTTVLLNIHNAGAYVLGSEILAMGIFYGGIAQVIAGCMEWKKNNTFGTTAFCSYGLFWLTLVGLLLLPKAGLWNGPTPAAMGVYLAMWGVFTGLMFIGTLRLNRALQVVFSSLTILFFLLAIKDFLLAAGIGSTAKTLGVVAGVEGVFCGLSAVYASIAQIINEVYQRTVLPLGPAQKKA